MKQQVNSINPHAAHATSLLAFIRSLFKHRQLILQMINREVIGRYKGSVIGMAWSFFNPIFMLSVYTVVFSIIFKLRWGVDGEDSKLQFALILFTGIIVLNFFIEVLNRAPILILSNVNYVKKVVFPLEILSVVSVGVALFHACISFLILVAAFFAFNGFLNITTLLIPIIFLPLAILSLGLSWILASLGVFIKDTSQAVGLLTTLLMFLSPVFYPISLVPEKFQPYIMLNPLTVIIEKVRQVMIWGITPNFNAIAIYLITSIFILQIGFAWFQKTRKGFADVI
jgi:lipopolysaccharide transport system permease protein